MQDSFRSESDVVSRKLLKDGKRDEALTCGLGDILRVEVGEPIRRWLVALDNSEPTLDSASGM